MVSNRNGHLFVELRILVALTLLVWLMIWAPDRASAQVYEEVKGSAFGYFCDVSAFGDDCAPSGPDPTVTLPPGGSATPVEDTSASARADVGPTTIFSSGQLSVVTSWDPESYDPVASYASIQNVNASGFTASQVDSECRATDGGAGGYINITSGTLATDNGSDLNLDGDFTDSGEHPSVTVNVPSGDDFLDDRSETYEGHRHIGDSTYNFKYVFNEQIRNPDGSLTVYAAHQYLLGPDYVGDLFIGKAECGASAPSTSDTVPPDTTITSGPSGTTADNTPTFEFTSSESGTSFECQVDTSAFTVCTSPHTTQPLAGSDHTFSVRAIDAAGNTDATPASQSFRVDDRPAVSIADGQITEGNRGANTFPFTVALSKASTEPVTIAYTTVDGTATVANSDYVATSGELTFLPGDTSKTINVSVQGDRKKEPNESFFVNLSETTNATIVDKQGIGTIVNDD
ncbi:MAG: hypothetical protein M3N15_00245 [Actinomycetota bacterium]|nr:hypothetical protein [Actinomycetota bacterium]